MNTTRFACLFHSSFSSFDDSSVLIGTRRFTYLFIAEVYVLRAEDERRTGDSRADSLPHL